MPTDTFYKLSQEKRSRVNSAAIREFCRVPFEKISIRNIVSDASIARGSFYQYFRDREDLLIHVLAAIRQNMEEDIPGEEDLFSFIHSMAVREMAIFDTRPDDLPDKTRILRNITRSPSAMLIFEREIGKNLRGNMGIHDKIRNCALRKLNDLQQSALLEMISQSVKTAMSQALSGEKKTSEALEGLAVKLEILRSGTEDLIDE